MPRHAHAGPPGAAAPGQEERMVRTLADIVRDHADQRGDYPMVTHGSRTITWPETEIS